MRPTQPSPQRLTAARRMAETVDALNFAVSRKPHLTHTGQNRLRLQAAPPTAVQRNWTRPCASHSVIGVVTVTSALTPALTGCDSLPKANF